MPIEYPVLEGRHVTAAAYFKETQAGLDALRTVLAEPDHLDSWANVHLLGSHCHRVRVAADALAGLRLRRAPDDLLQTGTTWLSARYAVVTSDSPSVSFGRVMVELDGPHQF